MALSPSNRTTEDERGAHRIRERVESRPYAERRAVTPDTFSFPGAARSGARSADGHNPLAAVVSFMVKKSTLVIALGVIFLFIPIPPIATIIGIVTILLGVVLRVLGGS